MSTLDISETVQPRSDQLNFDDVAATPLTITITEVRKGSAEQPVEIHSAEYPGRPYKPSKSMRRVLIAAWGPDAGSYAGKRAKLVGDPSVKFGGQTMGGIKIGALSHIDKPLALALTTTRGKRAVHTVDPLPETPAAPTAEQISASTDTDELKGWWRTAPALRTQIEARVAELRAAQDEAIDPATGEIAGAES